MGAIANVKPGEEDYERFYSSIAKGYRVQYDYRHTDGELFSCTAKDVDQARAKRDAWLQKKGAQA